MYDTEGRYPTPTPPTQTTHKPHTNHTQTPHFLLTQIPTDPQPHKYPHIHKPIYPHIPTHNQPPTTLPRPPRSATSDDRETSPSSPPTPPPDGPRVSWQTWSCSKNKCASRQPRTGVHYSIYHHSYPLDLPLTHHPLNAHRGSQGQVILHHHRAIYHHSYPLDLLLTYSFNLPLTHPFFPHPQSG